MREWKLFCIIFNHLKRQIQVFIFEFIFVNSIFNDDIQFKKKIVFYFWGF